MTTPQIAAPSIPTWEVLPCRPLEAIFQHLGMVQLQQMRLMCRHWNAAICNSPALMEQFVPRFYKKTFFAETEHAKQEEMAVLLSARFSTICIDVSNVARVARSPLWAKLAPPVRCLVVCNEQATLDVADLLTLLRMMPGLVRLELHNQYAKVKFSLKEVDFKLEQLEKLLLGASDTKWLGLLGGICPQLKVFKYLGGAGMDKSYTVADMMPFILAHQETLQKIAIIGIDRTANPLQLLAAAKKLKLNALTFEEFEHDAEGMRRIVDAEDVFQFCKTFSTIQNLKFKYDYLNTMVLRKFKANLAQLRKLSVHRFKPTESNSLKTLLSKMPLLEYLNVEAYITWQPDHFFDLRGVSCPNLKKLKVADFVFEKKGLAAFFQASQKIKFLSLQTFEVSNKAHLLETLSLLNSSLETLVMYENEFSESDLRGFKLDNLRVLCCSSVPLALRCPNLDSVRLLPSPTIVDEDIFALLRGLPRLRTLVIDQSDEQNELTDAALDFLASEGRGRLEMLHLEVMASTTSQAARDRLTEAFKNIAELRIKVDRDY